MDRSIVRNRPSDQQLDSMDAEQLHSLIVEALVNVARDYVLLGKALVRLEKMGQHVENIAANLQPLLRKLATGILVEEAAQHLTAKPDLLRYLSDLSHQEQIALLSGQIDVEIVLDATTGTSGRFKLLEIEWRHYRQLFDSHAGKRRTKVEQIFWLNNRKPPERVRTASPLYEAREDGLVFNGKGKIPWARVRKLLRDCDRESRGALTT